ncbi:MAG: zinc dependent phospholipase C family protein, partial [Blautia sp.]|nr:zinc dependent phospholipase C family protein [Blautia sp.]
MPTTYTHDVFGKQVYKMLPEEMKRIIRRNGEVYRIGLHGPDILFYFLISKNPVSQHGVKMHGERARDFFERGMKVVRDTGDEKLLSYLLGFGCHYLLDSVCHPYVNQMAAQRIITHTLLEKEMDRQLMINTGKDPLLYRPSDCVIPR